MVLYNTLVTNVRDFVAQHVPEQHRFARPQKPAAVDDLDAPLDNRADQERIVARIVFQVGVLNQDDVARGPIDAGADGDALALIDGLIDHDRARLRFFGLSAVHASDRWSRRRR